MSTYKEYTHNPLHLFIPNAIYLIAGSTVGKKHYLETNEKKEFFCTTLVEHSSKLNWQLEAWACLANHYHTIAQAPECAETLPALIRAVHSLSARYVNKIDNIPGRKIWSNYWDTCIRNEKLYLTMLRYVHENPVKHQLVENAENYPFSSYRWFLDSSDTEFQNDVMTQSLERLIIDDDY
jgi:putative transposase